MNATRIERGSTSDSASQLLAHIADKNSDVRLFATHPDETGKGYDQHSGPVVNLPLVVALVFDGRRWLVYDGNLLNARRGPRIAEVRDVIDAAVKEGTVLYGTTPVDFTASQAAEDAARYLSHVPTRYLNESTRMNYELMLGMS